MSDRLDIIVFGATGFTGKYVLPYLYKFSKTKEKNLTWGVAGRSLQKLKDALAEAAEKIGISDLNNVPIIIANIENEETLKKMTAQAKVVINCCGPFQLYGEAVVKACIETATSHIDVTAESEFMERIELKYCKAAEEKGIYVVSACGVASLPIDMGITFLENNFKGTLNSVEAYFEWREEGGFTSKPQMHYATWESVVNSLGSYREMNSLRKLLYPNPLPTYLPKLPLRFVHKMEDTNKWAIPFIGPLDDVVNRSQRYFYENHRKRPVQVQSYMLIDSFWYVLVTLFYGITVALLSQFQFGRNLLLKYPEYFSNGFFSHKDPSKEVLERHYFSLILNGKGWKKSQSGAEENNEEKPSTKIVGRFYARNPGYDYSALSLALCAVTIVTEPKLLPARGGVYTTSALFSKTTLLEKLQSNDVTFEILSNKNDQTNTFLKTGSRDCMN